MRGADSVFYPMLFQPRKGGDVEIVQSRQVVDDVHALVKNGGGLTRGQNPQTGRHSEPCIELQVWECWYGPGTGSQSMATSTAGQTSPVLVEERQCLEQHAD